ncbi:SPOSA6832_01489 [Sporobolomyces salmonicolor]|uniref:SPOSA6832_01489-mRNA-1:cds n=1 Tax=Sporidiobolus salmonicolor TaxID=5005 RepID=A0A0D6EIQ8_SPOSA|nr:SPOSA6832_01489 [Sporobolomyces salmonicolor]
MSYGLKSWANWVLEEEESMKHFKLAYDLGINTWDTANVYSNGISEVLVGKAIKELKIPRENLVLLTKVSFPLVFMTVADDPNVHPSKLQDPDSQGYVNRHGLSRKHIFDSVKASLERMGVDYVDVLQCHRFDAETPLEETMDALHDVVKAGYARYIGMSSCWAWQFHAMQNYAKSKGGKPCNLTRHLQRGFTMHLGSSTDPPSSDIDFYSPIYREEEREMFPTVKLFGCGVIPWSPLARGFMTRPWREQGNTERGKSDPNFAKFVGLGNPAGNVEKIAKDRGVSMAQVSLAWVLAQPTVTAPIIGSTRVEAIKELAQATHLKLTEEEIKAISEPYKPRGILGHS